MSATNLPEPHRFLIESDLSGLEELRKLVATDRKAARPVSRCSLSGSARTT